MRVLLTGASGQLGAYMIDPLRAAGHQLTLWSGSEAGARAGLSLEAVDLAELDALPGLLDRVDPEAVLHVGAIASAETARLDPERARLVNVEATARIAAWCRERGRRLLFTSTDMVFDGRRPWNVETDPADPVLTYGRTKRQAESAVLGCPRGMVARLSLLYGPGRHGRTTYLDRTLAAMRRGELQTFFEDEFRTPLDLPTAAEILAALLESEAIGVVHVAGPERVSRYDLMRRITAASGLDSRLVRANLQADAASAEPRPVDVSLDTTRLMEILPDLRRPTIEQAAERFAAATQPDPDARSGGVA